MALNHELTHDEVKGNPGYSDGGAYAGRERRPQPGANWDHGNPYESAPIHLDQLLAPRLQWIGTADADGYSCTTTFPGWSRPPIRLTRLTSTPTPETAPRSTRARRRSRSRGRPGASSAIHIRHAPVRTCTCSSTPPGSSRVQPRDALGGDADRAIGSRRGQVRRRKHPDPGGGALAGYLSPGGFIIPVAPLTGGATPTAPTSTSRSAGRRSRTTGRSRPRPSPGARALVAFRRPEHQGRQAPRRPRVRLTAQGAPRHADDHPADRAMHRRALRDDAGKLLASDDHPRADDRARRPAAREGSRTPPDARYGRLPAGRRGVVRRPRARGHHPAEVNPQPLLRGWQLAEVAGSSWPLPAHDAWTVKNPPLGGVKLSVKLPLRSVTAVCVTDEAPRSPV